jgi:acyl carrier protein
MEIELNAKIADLMEVDASALVNDKILDEIEAWDSVTMLGLVVVLSDYLGEPVNPGEIGQFETFGDIVLFINKKKS